MKNERSINSTDWLIDRISSKIFDLNHQCIYFIDRDLLLGNPNSNRREIVFFGNFIRSLDKITDIEQYDDLWALSEPVAQIIRKKYPQKIVKTIDRYQLISKAAPENIKAIGKNFFYAGRCSPEKNILSLIVFLNELQKKYPESSVKFFFLPSPEFPDYEEKMKAYLNKLEWVNKPKIFEGLGPEQWRKEIDHDSFNISLSSFFCEDFGVSVAETEEMGINSILSYWGGHVHCEDAFFIPSKLIPFLGESDEVLIQKGKLLGQCLDLSNKSNFKSEVCDFSKLEFLDHKSHQSAFWLDYVQVFMQKRISSIRFVKGCDWQLDEKSDLILDEVLAPFLMKEILKRNIEISFDG